jgi:hypothetical protein
MCLSMWYENDVPLIPWQEVSDNSLTLEHSWSLVIGRNSLFNLKNRQLF